MMNMTMKKPTTWKTPPMEAPLRPFFGDGRGETSLHCITSRWPPSKVEYSMISVLSK